MRWTLAALLIVHGLIHFMGFAKAFGLAELPQLSQPISHGMGVLWLTAGLMVVAAALTLMAWPRGFWLGGALALVLSQGVILSAWRDAWAGTAMNVVLLLMVAHGWLTEGPRGFGTQMDPHAPLRAPAESSARRHIK